MMAFIPGTNHAWLVNELRNSAARFIYRPRETKILKQEEEIPLLPPTWNPAGESTASHLFCTKNYCLFSLRGPDRLAVVKDGTISFGESAGKGPRFFLADPKNHRLYIAWQYSRRISEYSLADSGESELMEHPLELPEPTCMALIPES
jgi:6-phosphogluconolactonase (cycloisomerase 2 family)